MSDKDSVSQFNFDIRRSCLLSTYMAEWGIPKSRVIASHSTRFPVEVYFFDGGQDQNVVRFSTVGLSAHRKSGDRAFDHELLFVLPKDLGGASTSDVFNYLLDISAYALRDDVKFGVESLIKESTLAPESWNPKAIFIDEARGESESFEKMHVGTQHVSLLWLVPIYNNEYHQILVNGIDSFDRLCDKSEFSLVDVARPSVVPIRSV